LQRSGVDASEMDHIDGQLDRTREDVI